MMEQGKRGVLVGATLIRFSCPSCGTVTFFPDSKVGQNSWCPACQSEFRVRGAITAVPDTPRVTGPKAALWASAVVLPVLSLVTAGILYFMQSSEPAEPAAPAPAARVITVAAHEGAPAGTFVKRRVRRMFGPVKNTDYLFGTGS